MVRLEASDLSWSFLAVESTSVRSFIADRGDVALIEPQGIHLRSAASAEEYVISFVPGAVNRHSNLRTWSAHFEHFGGSAPVRP